MKQKSNKTYFKSLDINNLNDDLPLKLKALEPMVENIYKKYPVISKGEISLIIKMFMEEIREQLLQGYSINVYQCLLNMKLYTYCKLNNDKLLSNVRIQVNTPKRIKYAK